LKGRQIISLPGAPTCLGPALSVPVLLYFPMSLFTHRVVCSCNTTFRSTWPPSGSFRTVHESLRTMCHALICDGLDVGSDWSYIRICTLCHRLNHHSNTSPCVESVFVMTCVLNGCVIYAASQLQRSLMCVLVVYRPTFAKYKCRSFQGWRTFLKVVVQIVNNFRRFFCACPVPPIGFRGLGQWSFGGTCCKKNLH